jgi:hypothetical protein
MNILLLLAMFIHSNLLSDPDLSTTQEEASTSHTKATDEFKDTLLRMSEEIRKEMRKMQRLRLICELLESLADERIETSDGTDFYIP